MWMKEWARVGPKGSYIYTELERRSPAYMLSHGDQTKNTCAWLAPHQLPAHTPDLEQMASPWGHMAGWTWTRHHLCCPLQPGSSGHIWDRDFDSAFLSPFWEKYFKLWGIPPPSLRNAYIFRAFLLWRNTTGVQKWGFNMIPQAVRPGTGVLTFKSKRRREVAIHKSTPSWGLMRWRIFRNCEWFSTQ